jgi:hypothetical protein
MVQLISEAIKRLNTLLSLPYRDGMQDWDIELADSNRVQEFCDVYESEGLDSNEKQALMALIIASYDDYLEERGNEVFLWNKIAALLRKDCDLHKSTMLYWLCVDNEELIGEFAITPLIRALLPEKLCKCPTMNSKKLVCTKSQGEPRPPCQSQVRVKSLPAGCAWRQIERA